MAHPSHLAARESRVHRDPVVGAAIGISAIFGVLGTIAGIVKVFGAVGSDSIDPSQKAHILAEGISEAINCAVFSAVLWIPSAIVAFVLTRRKHAEPKV